MERLFSCKRNDLLKIQTRYNMKFILNTLLCLMFVSANISAQVPAEKVPDFNFFRLNKQPFTTKDLEQGKMLFFVFFDTDCDHCQRAMQYMDRHYPEFKKTAIYLVTLDSREKINSFMSRFGGNLTSKKNVIILQDPKFDFMNKFKPRKYPSIFLYSTDKRLLVYEDNEKSLPVILEKIKKSS